MNKPSILMITTQLGYGGAETSFIRLANLLSETMDVTVALFTESYGRSDYAAGNEPLLVEPIILDRHDAGPVRRWLLRIAHIRKLKKSHPVTISFLSGPNLVNVFAGRNRRSIVSLRGSRQYDPVASRWQKALFQYFLDPIIFALAARIVPVSPGLIHEIRSVAGNRAANKAVVITPFIDYAQLSARLAESAPEGYSPLSGQEVIVAAGRLSPEKGFHHLLRIIALLKQQRPGIKLLLIGDGPMLNSLKEQASILGLAIDNQNPDVASVIFTGYQKNVLPFMKLGKIFVLSSSTEGFPNALLEASIAQLDLVAADGPWGARAILNPTDSATPAPFATRIANKTAFGTLMPRIDTPDNACYWAEVLNARLSATDRLYLHPHQLDEFDVARIGKQWKQLIHDIL